MIYNTGGPTVDSKPVPKVTSRMVYCGSKSCYKDMELLDFDYGLPQYALPEKKQTMPEYSSGTDEKHTLSFGHIGHSLARRVCTEGVDIGTRFLYCSYEGYEACGFVKWLDDEWQGRTRSVITKLVEDNGKLKMKVTDTEGTIND